MKHKIFLTCSLLIALFFSCTKSSELDSGSSQPGSLAGKWKLTETLFDPGDGSGTWHPTDSAGYYIQFNQDSSFSDNFNSPFIPSVYPDFIKYSVLNDSMINFVDSAGNLYERRYVLQKDMLTITGGCYEACGSKYKR